jgi:hypothetical protein
MKKTAKLTSCFLICMLTVVKGTMRFIPLEAGTWPVLFEEVLGSVAEPHAPY